MSVVKATYVHSVGCIASIDSSFDSNCGCDEFTTYKDSVPDICSNCLHSFSDHIGMTINDFEQLDQEYEDSLDGLITHLESMVSCMLRHVERESRAQLLDLQRELAIQDQTRLTEQIRVLDAIKSAVRNATLESDASSSTPPRQKARHHSPPRFAASLNAAAHWTSPVASTAAPAAATTPASTAPSSSSPFKSACDDWKRTEDATASARSRLQRKRTDMMRSTSNGWIAGIERNLQEMKSVRRVKQCYFNCSEIVSCLGHITSHLLSFWSNPEGIRYLLDSQFAQLYRGYFTRSLCHVENILMHHPPPRHIEFPAGCPPHNDLYHPNFIQYAQISLQPHLFNTLPMGARPDYFYTTLHQSLHCYGKHHPFLFEPISAVADVTKEVCARLNLDASFAQYFKDQFTDICGLIERRTFEQPSEWGIDKEIHDFRLTNSMIRVSILSEILELAISADLKQQIQSDMANDWKQANSPQGLTYNITIGNNTASASASSSSSSSEASFIPTTVPARAAGVPNSFPYKPFGPYLNQMDIILPILFRNIQLPQDDASAGSRAVFLHYSLFQGILIRWRHHCRQIHEVIENCMAPTNDVGGVIDIVMQYMGNPVNPLSLRPVESPFF